MGLLSSIVSTAKKVVTAVAPTKEKLNNVVNVLSQSLNPLSKVKPTVNLSVAKIPIVGTAVKTLVEHPFISAAAVATPVAIVKSPPVAAAATTVAKSLIPKSSIGKIATVAAVPVVAGAVIKQPDKVILAAISTPSALANFGGNVATLIVDPSIDNAKKVIKENPIITTAVGAAAVAAVGIGTANVLSNIANTQAIKENTASKLPTNTLIPSTPNISQNSQAVTSAVPTISGSAVAASPVPVTPETKPLIATAGGSNSLSKRKRRKLSKNMPSMRQTVNVAVGNRVYSVRH